jgi:hypothetical protein
MRGVLVCHPEELVVLAIGTVGMTGRQGSRVLGSCGYQREWIDRYIARVFLEATGPIHVFNSFIGDGKGEPCPWARDVLARSQAFEQAYIIPPCVYHGKQEWITPFEGLRTSMSLDNFAWPKAVAVRDEGVDATLRRDEGKYSVSSLEYASTNDDTATVRNIDGRSSAFLQQLICVHDQLQHNAERLQVTPPMIEISMLERWAESNTDPTTCAACLSAIYGDHPAFSRDCMSALLSAAPDETAVAATETPMHAVIRADTSTDSGVGVEIATCGDYYIVSYCRADLPSLLLPGVEIALASRSEYHREATAAENVVVSRAS